MQPARRLRRFVCFAFLLAAFGPAFAPAAPAGDLGCDLTCCPALPCPCGDCIRCLP
ncbi:hypothetical protein [Mesoterricola sediminis]|uniref:Uncharacterized protein n=1 Tax=Mesoterricola sediminis TaxID=2927980 RepID=A0AA48HG48_9BACT|nr:hypothetical protein [Mesoterricola sediminis]BDU77583.1 hypothetical protein METESE_25410 [Mesoterricola sediminis]